jgi:hypothetical protein
MPKPGNAPSLLDEHDDTTAIAPREPSPMVPAVSAFERMAADPNVSVEKLERLIAMQERINAHEAKAAFDSAFAEMQGEIPIITERGEILVNGQLRSRYAKLEDILEVVRPILTKHGFAIRHRNEFADWMIKIVGILSHRGGHSEYDEFVAKADVSGGKNEIQALGSTRAYGQRYTTIALLGIATKGQDNDGAGSQVRSDIKAPEGFETWLEMLETVADNGLADLTDAFNKSKPELRNHLTRTNPSKWAALKTRAQKAKARA